jgi:LuxR family glucitol operon transcriptional activator
MEMESDNNQGLEKKIKNLTVLQKAVLLKLREDLEDCQIAKVVGIRNQREDAVRKHIQKIGEKLLPEEKNSEGKSYYRDKLKALPIKYEWLQPKDTAKEGPTVTQIPKSSWQRRQNLSSKLQNLPPQDNEFIGRTEELSKLMKLLRPDRAASIIIVDGIGGVGKTALALEAAYLCLECREYGKALSTCSEIAKIVGKTIGEIPSFDAVIFATAKESRILPTGNTERLEAQRTFHEIVRKISKTLDDPTLLDSESEEQLERIRKSLRKQRTLLIVDNLETIEDKDKVLSFISELPLGVKSIITTREPLGYAPIRLEHLPEPDSLRLIQQQLEEKSVTLTVQERKELYSVTGGIPVAIIYAVGRLAASQSLETVLEDLRNANGDIACFCFKKSVDDIREQPAYRMLMSIAIFHSPPIQDAAIEVAGLSTEPGEARRALDKLKQLSLIRLHDGRYRMLPLTREYALAELNKNQEFKRDAQNRWVKWYLQFAEKHNGEKWRLRHIGYDCIEEEWENFLAVLRWCKDEDRYQDVRDLWFLLNNYANLRGAWKDRLFWLDWILDRATRIGEYKTVIQSKSKLGRTLLLKGKQEELEKAETLLLTAWELQDYADFEDLDYLANHLAGLYIRMENYEEAHRWLDKEQDLLERVELEDKKGINYQIYIHRERAEVFFYQKKYPQAKLLCSKATELAETVGNQRNKNYVQRILADIAIAEAGFSEAERLLKEGYEEVNSNQDKRRMAYYETSFANLEKARNNLEQAKQWANKAQSNFNYLGMERDSWKVISLLREMNTV